jgi:hypothetical protein
MFMWQAYWRLASCWRHHVSVSARLLAILLPFRVDNGIMPGIRLWPAAIFFSVYHNPGDRSSHFLVWNSPTFVWSFRNCSSFRIVVSCHCRIQMVGLCDAWFFHSPVLVFYECQFDSQCLRFPYDQLSFFMLSVQTQFRCNGNSYHYMLLYSYVY